MEQHNNYVRNILFVDDDQILCDAVTKSLAKYSESFAIATAHDGFDAVKQLKKLPVSLVILDLIMPRMDGMSLINHLKEHYSDLPFIIISSVDDLSLQEIAKASSASDYFKKPFQAERLVSAITLELQKEAAGGTMHDISPTVFLQLMEMDAKSCTIRILDNASYRGGIIFFKDGEMLDARIGELHGIEAAYELFSWDNATIFMRNECVPRENVINSSLTPIIMKAVGIKDEAEEQHPEDSSDPQLQGRREDSKAVSAGNATRMAALRKVLGKELELKQIPDAQLTNVIEELTKLSASDDFGEFTFAYVSSNKSNKIILAGQPPTVLELELNCAPEKLINLLKTMP